MKYTEISKKADEEFDLGRIKEAISVSISNLMVNWKNTIIPDAVGCCPCLTLTDDVSCYSVILPTDLKWIPISLLKQVVPILFPQSEPLNILIMSCRSN